MGRGQEFAFTADYSERRNDYSISFTEPALFDQGAHWVEVIFITKHSNLTPMSREKPAHRFAQAEALDHTFGSG